MSAAEKLVSLSAKKKTKAGSRPGQQGAPLRCARAVSYRLTYRIIDTHRGARASPPPPPQVTSQKPSAAPETPVCAVAREANPIRSSRHLRSHVDRLFGRGPRPPCPLPFSLTSLWSWLSRPTRSDDSALTPRPLAPEAPSAGVMQGKQRTIWHAEDLRPSCRIQLPEARQRGPTAQPKSGNEKAGSPPPLASH
ncbi:hypothetical protein BS50DRAFT_587476 [Corynespora cassiicola Philippines]|uniref:Uncharacterized protein n=1 Tax=Corynespora cassiicola Philippines TaxID=1448308 RepID=A0A2T2NS69_CORCC|nr:hypothetical protein BS50DRAFT_587476 [Corynespora cassiicola Philippines]